MTQRVRVYSAYWLGQGNQRFSSTKGADAGADPFDIDMDAWLALSDAEHDRVIDRYLEGPPRKRTGVPESARAPRKPSRILPDANTEAD